MLPMHVAQALADVGITTCSMRPLSGGFSHAAWHIEDAEGGQYVLRLCEAARAGRATIEAALLRHIAAEAGEAVPVPEVIASGPDYTVLRYIEGQTLAELLHQHKALTSDLTPLAAELGRILAQLSTVRFAHPGFFTDEDLTLTQEAPWSQQFVPFCSRHLAASNRFTTAECARWQQICQHQQANVAVIDPVSTLVHSDFNPKNIIVQRAADGIGWHIAALIDWEFSHAGSPLVDVGNFCRFGEDYPEGFLAGFLQGFSAAYADLPVAWHETARALDMFALSELATRARGHPIGDKAEQTIRQWIANGLPPLA